jgi:hypothetical protein
MAPQTIEIAQNGLRNGDPPARDCWTPKALARSSAKAMMGR